MIYDYIFCGFGLSTLLVLEEFEVQNLLVGKSILILEKEASFPEKTWCFWERGVGKWDDLLSGMWSKGYVKDEFQRVEVLDGLLYKCLPSAALRNRMMEKLQNYNCVFKNQKTISWDDCGDRVVVRTESQSYTSQFFFNSSYTAIDHQIQSNVLLQHFEGWFVKTKSPAFIPSEALIMDFSVAQKGNTRFMYVLPFSETTALVEYTLFSPSLIPEKEYADEIHGYLEDRNITEFEITAKEFGVIPMTVHPFWKQNTRNVLHIGTAGGWTKASTGYTFKTAEKYASKLATMLNDNPCDFSKFYEQSRFNWYDSLFIDVLHRDNKIGKNLFMSLFTKARSNEVMAFLHEETTLIEEIGIIANCPQRPFLAALGRKLFT